MRKTIVTFVPSDAYLAKVGDVLKRMHRAGYEGVYVSFQRPIQNIESLFAKWGVKTMLYYVHACPGVGLEEPNPRSVCIPAVFNPEELIRKIQDLLQKIRKKKFILVDSLTTAALYNDKEEVLRFAQSLAVLSKKVDAKLICITAKELRNVMLTKSLRSLQC